MSPQPGTKVQVRNAYDEISTMVALTSPQPGRDFPIVWVCPEDVYERAQARGDEPEGVAWPLSALVSQ